eukprot:29570-Pelagococcus_subviridis.AAC.11
MTVRRRAPGDATCDASTYSGSDVPLRGTRATGGRLAKPSTTSACSARHAAEVNDQSLSLDAPCVRPPPSARWERSSGGGGADGGKTSGGVGGVGGGGRDGGVRPPFSPAAAASAPVSVAAAASASRARVVFARALAACPMFSTPPSVEFPTSVINFASPGIIAGHRCARRSTHARPAIAAAAADASSLACFPPPFPPFPLSVPADRCSLAVFLSQLALPTPPRSNPATNPVTTLAVGPPGVPTLPTPETEGDAKSKCLDAIHAAAAAAASSSVPFSAAAATSCVSAVSTRCAALCVPSASVAPGRALTHARVVAHSLASNRNVASAAALLPHNPCHSGTVRSVADASSATCNHPESSTSFRGLMLRIPSTAATTSSSRNCVCFIAALASAAAAFRPGRLASTSAVSARAIFPPIAFPSSFVHDAICRCAF